MRREYLQFGTFYGVNMKLLARVAIAVAAFFASSNLVEAAPVYSQVLPVEPGSSFVAGVTVGSQKVADNFEIDGTGPVSVRSLRFLGGYGANSPTSPLDILPPDSFRVVFLENVAGSPGMPIAGGDFSNLTAFSRASTGGKLLNGFFKPVEFVIDLGIGVALNRGTEYWISIGNDAGPDYSWSWARAESSFDLQLASTTDDVTAGSWAVGASSGMWFELNDQSIPEPNSFALSLVAVSAFTFRRISKRHFSP